MQDREEAARCGVRGAGGLLQLSCIGTPPFTRIVRPACPRLRTGVMLVLPSAMRAGLASCATFAAATASPLPPHLRHTSSLLPTPPARPQTAEVQAPAKPQSSGRQAEIYIGHAKGA